MLAATPGGGSVAVAADTVIGRALWTTGEFERHELLEAARLAEAETYAFDVGANVGLFAVVMSRAVGAGGRVIAVEPVSDTVHRLRENLARNRCANVEVREGAAAAASGEVPLMLTDDPAFHTADGQPSPGHPIRHTRTVKAFTLDEIWINAGRPPVSLVKIDVEGSEPAVLVGAAQMISGCRPAIIVEVANPLHVPWVTKSLAGYRAQPVRGFEPWNHLMVPE